MNIYIWIYIHIYMCVNMYMIMWEINATILNWPIFLPSSAHNFYKYWWISIKFSGEVAEYHIHTMEMYIGPLVTYKYVLYGQKYAELGKIVWHFQSIIFLQFFFVCKSFTNIGKLYLKRKEISSSFQIWSQNWNIWSS